MNIRYVVLSIMITAICITHIAPVHAQTSGCESKRVAGDYNCDTFVNLDDFESMRPDLVAQKVSLIYFEYWRKAQFGSPAPTRSEPTPTVTSQTKQQLITQAIAAISKQKITDTIVSIADDDDTPAVDATQTRWSNSAGNQTERAYMKQQLESIGYTVTPQSFSTRGVNSANVIARLPGKDPLKYYIISSHLDSTSATDDADNDPAPGADDNGSGTAAVLEVARVLKSLSTQLNYSVEFIMFSGEEQGLYGSKYYASRVTTSNVLGVFNMDMVGWNPASRGDCVQFGYIARSGGNLLSDKASEIDKTYNIQLKADSVLTNIRGSDHFPFVDRGMKGILISECALMEGRVGTVQPNYHSTRDKPDTLHYNQIEKTAKVVVGTVIDLAY